MKKQLNIDIHQHFVPQAYFDAVGSDPEAFGATLEEGSIRTNSGHTVKWHPTRCTAQGRIKDMDDARVDMAAISLLPPLFGYSQPSAVGQRIATLVNDALAEVARNNPDRFFAVGHVPLQDVAASVAELERRHFAAVQIGSNVNGRNLDDPELLPFFQAAARLGTFIFVHPTVGHIIGKDRLKRYTLTNLIGNPTDTAVAIASVIFGGVLDACPNLRMCFAHAGGSAPYIWGRWEHGQRMGLTKGTATPVAELRKRIYVDCLAHSPSSLRFLIDEVGPDRVMLGSDYPAAMGDNGQVSKIEQLGLSTDTVRKVLGENAAGILGIGGR